VLPSSSIHINLSMGSSVSDRPQVIFLDAVGTLFGVRGTVGEQYAKIARQFGVELSAEVLDHAFIKSFKAAGTPAFSESSLAELHTKEFIWWKEVAIQTFTAANALHQFDDFRQFFKALFDYFATAEPWVVYPDTIQQLQRWQQIGIPMGIISNFDSRIYSVLHALDLIDYFTSITISTESGVAKPDRRIFEIALEKHDCPATAAWHIGDSYREDYQAAKAAELRSIWLRR
jgi:putative hydrolase of the HAD superfamily